MFCVCIGLHLLSRVQFSSVTQSCPTLCDPMNRSMPGLPVHHQLPEFTPTHVHRVSDAIQPSHSLLSPYPPAPNPSQHESFPMSQLFAWGGQSTGVSALASFFPKKSQGWSPSEWTGWISLQSKGLSIVFSNTLDIFYLSVSVLFKIWYTFVYFIFPYYVNDAWSQKYIYFKDILVFEVFGTILGRAQGVTLQISYAPMMYLFLYRGNWNWKINLDWHTVQY